MPSTPSSAQLERRRRWVLPLAALLVVLLIGGITALAVVSAHDGDSGKDAACPNRLSPDAERVHVGSTMPTFSLPDLGGRCVDSATYRGQPLVVNFWASWCHPCRTEFPLLAEARAHFANRDVEVLGITYRDIESDARGFAEERGADWPLLFDGDGDVARVFGVTQIPQTFFFASDGTLISHVYGLTSPRALNTEIRRILKR